MSDYTDTFLETAADKATSTSTTQLIDAIEKNKSPQFPTKSLDGTRILVCRGETSATSRQFGVFIGASA